MEDISINFILPSVMILLGVIMRIRKAEYPGLKRQVFRSGYRSKRALISKEHWDFAQIIAPVYLLRYGIIAFLFELICTGIIVFYKVESEAVSFIFTFIPFLFMFIAFYNIEKRIAFKFNN